jgi:hypothetical protein
MGNQKNKVVDFKTSGYFSGFIIVTGVLFVVVAVATLRNNVIVSGVLAVLALLIFTTHYRLSIDVEKKTYHDYLWILGFRKGERGTFESLDCLFVRKSRVSQKMQLRAVSSTVHKEIFDGYLKLSGDRRIHLLTADDKDSVVKFLKSVAARLDVKVMDYCSAEPVEI